MEKIVNLDNASTTMVYKEVINEISYALSEDNYNMGARYEAAKKVEKKFNYLKSKLLSALGAYSGEIIVAPSATIANNLCLMSLNPKSKGEIIINISEHPSVYECAVKLKNSGANVVFCPVKNSGEIDLEKLSEIVTDKTQFVSIMHVNNETGAINDIKQVAILAKSKNKNCLVHADGVQAFGKIPVNLTDLGVDFYTISAHKIGGPKGVGVLWAKDKNTLKPLIFGGGQELGLISGTQNYPLFAGMMTAVNLKLNSLEDDYHKVLFAKTSLIENLTQLGVEFSVNGSDSFSPYILNLSFKGVRGEVLLNLLSLRGILVSNGSACASAKQGNRILEAMGKTKSEIDGAVRFSFDAREEYNTKELAKIICEEIKKIKH